MNNDRIFAIGRITKPHGIKGEAKIEIITDTPECFQELEEVFLAKSFEAEEKISAKIESARYHQGSVLVKFDLIKTPEDVEKYRNYYVLAPQCCLPPLNEDEYYVSDLIKMKVRTVEGEEVGEITRVIPSGFHDIYEITNPDTKKINLVPSCRQFIKSIDTQNRVIIIEPIEGLLDL